MTTVREILDEFLESKGTTFEKVLVDEIDVHGMSAMVGDVVDSAFYKLGTSVCEVVDKYVAEHGLSGLCHETNRKFYSEDDDFVSRDDFTDNDYYLDLVTAIKEPCNDPECCVPGCRGFHFWPAESGPKA
jgi:hypothetical protein